MNTLQQTMVKMRGAGMSAKAADLVGSLQAKQDQLAQLQVDIATAEQAGMAAGKRAQACRMKAAVAAERRAQHRQAAEDVKVWQQVHTYVHSVHSSIVSSHNNATACQQV